MADNAAETATNPTETVTTQPVTGDGTQPTTGQPLRTLETAEQRIKELNAENLRLRKLADAAEKAKADAAAATAAEQGRFQELYEAEKKARADYEAKLAQVEHDQQRRDAAQAAGIPQLWERLKGATAEELAEDAKALAAFVQPAQPAQGQPRTATTAPTPAPQGQNGLTPEERRARAARTI